MAPLPNTRRPGRATTRADADPAKPPLGQHFLADPAAVERMVAAARVTPGQTVVDVGAGRGVITHRLAQAVAPRGRVVAIEFDPALAAVLRSRAMPGVDVVEGDALKVALPARVDAVVSNPPFGILAPLVFRLLAEGVGCAVLVVPREFSQAALARPATEHYARITVRLRLRARIERAFTLPPASFTPAPETPCAVLRVTPQPLPVGVDDGVLETVLTHAWASRRRTLRRGLAPVAAALRVSSGQVSRVLEERRWGSKRPTELSPAQYAELAAALVRKA